MPHNTTRFNKAGIPVHEIRTVPIPAFVWAGNFQYRETTVLVKLTKNR